MFTFEIFVLARENSFIVMSQSTKKLNPESEDLFTTQDLLIVDDETLDETNDATINDLEVHPDDEFMAEMETEAELLEGMDEDDETTENDIQEENEQTEFLVETSKCIDVKSVSR